MAISAKRPDGPVLLRMPDSVSDAPLADDADGAIAGAGRCSTVACGILARARGGPAREPRRRRSSRTRSSRRSTGGTRCAKARRRARHGEEGQLNDILQWGCWHQGTARGIDGPFCESGRIEHRRLRDLPFHTPEPRRRPTPGSAARPWHDHSLGASLGSAWDQNTGNSRPSEAPKIHRGTLKGGTVAESVRRAIG